MCLCLRPDRRRQRSQSPEHADGDASSGPTRAEVDLEARQRTASLDGATSLCAVAMPWWLSWLSYVAENGPAPGPVDNKAVVASVGTDASPEVELRWLSVEDWQMLRDLHGGGPVLRRSSQEVFPSSVGECGDEDSHPGATTSTKELVARLRKATYIRERRRQVLEEDMALEAAELSDLLTKQRSKAASSASVAVELEDRIFAEAIGAKNPETMRQSLHALRAAGATAGTGSETAENCPKIRFGGLEAIVSALCLLEEAQAVLACLMTAVTEADRLSLETWLEQAESLDIETVAPNLLLIGPLHQHVVELEDRELRMLDSHAEMKPDSQSPAAQLWFLTLAALEAEDPSALEDLVAEAKACGLDATPVEFALEELVSRQRGHARRQEFRRRADEEWGASGYGTRPSREANADCPEWENPSGWQSTDDFINAFRRKQQREGKTTYAGGAGGATPSWEDPSNWRSTDDFINAWRRKQRERGGSAAGSGWEEFSRGVPGAGERFSASSTKRQAPPPSAPSKMDMAMALAALGLPAGRSPSMAEVKAAYKAAALKVHPDRPQNRNRQAEATAQFQQVKAAFDFLAHAGAP